MLRILATYNFFDYKAFIEGYENNSDMFSPAHLILSGSLITLMIVLCILLRNINHNKVTIYLRICTFVFPLFEIYKIVWESYWDIKLGAGFNWGGILPLYTCSMFMYVLPFASFGKGKVKDVACAFLSTIGIFAGLTNFFYLNILWNYPLFSFAAL